MRGVDVNYLTPFPRGQQQIPLAGRRLALAASRVRVGGESCCQLPWPFSHLFALPERGTWWGLRGPVGPYPTTIYETISSRRCVQIFLSNTMFQTSENSNVHYSQGSWNAQSLCSTFLCPTSSQQPIIEVLNAGWTQRMVFGMLIRLSGGLWNMNQVFNS